MVVSVYGSIANDVIIHLGSPVTIGLHYAPTLPGRSLSAFAFILQELQVPLVHLTYSSDMEN